MNKLLLFCAFLCFSFSSISQIVNIPDPNFKAELLNYSNPVIDTNNDGQIQVSEAEAVGGNDQLLFFSDISDVTGIEAFVNLKWLEFINVNSITEINLSDLILLENFYIISENLVIINLSGLVNIKKIDIYSDNIIDLDLSDQINLEELRYESSIFNSPTLQNLMLPVTSTLTFLSVKSTLLTEIDVSNYVNLEYIDIRSSNINSLDVTNLPNLRFLYFTFSNISEIDLSQNNEIEFLQVGYSNLTELDVSNLNQLENIIFSGNNFTEIDLSNNNSLIQVFGENCIQLQSLNLKNGNNTNINFLRLMGSTNLDFICVDDVNYAIANFTDIEPQVTFIDDCSILDTDPNRIDGTVAFDLNTNNCDNGSLPINGYLVNSSDGSGNFGTIINQNGNYLINVGEGTYTTQVLGLPPYFDTNPATATNTFVGFDQTQTANFCVVPNTTANDLTVSMFPINKARPGFEAFYEIIYENVGTTTLTGEVTLNFSDVQIDFVEATPNPTNVTNNSLTFNVGSLAPFAQGSILVTFLLEQPPINESGNQLAFTATINPTSGDATPEDNEFFFPQVIVNSFDPNDKTCVQGYQVLIDDADKYLHYIVRFQNLGTASAVNVRVVDELDELLDFSTFRVLTASHDMETTLIDGQIDFIFDDIFLPAEMDDPEGSNGYITYKIKPLPGVVVGDEVNNRADIYFDFNPPVLTNTTATFYVDELGIEDAIFDDVVLYPNPATNVVNIKTANTIQDISVVNTLGQQVEMVKISADKKQLDISALATGMYFVKVNTAQGTGVYQVLKK